MSKPIYDMPTGFEGKFDLEKSQSIKSCADCDACLDVYPSIDGKSVLVVGDDQHMVISKEDFIGLQGLKL